MQVASIVPPGFDFVPIKYEDRYVIYNPGTNDVATSGSSYVGPLKHWPMQGVAVGKFLQETRPYVDYVFSFNVKNPPEGRFGSTKVTMELCEIPLIDMAMAKYNAHPGVISGHIYPPVIFQVLSCFHASPCVKCCRSVCASSGARMKDSSIGLRCT